MINNLRISGYKSLQMAECINLTNLNILVGANASGKSSLIQSLLLLRQSASRLGSIAELKLSGDLYEGGTVLDVLHPEARHAVEIELVVNENAHTFAKFSWDRENPAARKLSAEAAVELSGALVGRDGSFAYLNAERVGPRVSYPLPREDNDLAGSVGKFGEFTTAVLARSLVRMDGWSDETLEILAKGPAILDGVQIRDVLGRAEGRIDLLANAMLGWIIPGATFSAEEDSRTDSAPLIFLRDPLGTKVPTRATHVGFGLAYILPIIAAALSVNKNGILIVENPEAHLHPFGQSRIGAFLAAIAATGRQVFIETHSDHVVNGIRLAVKKDICAASKVIFNYLRIDKTGSQSIIKQILADSDGRLDEWPSGFFDQIECDLSRL